MCAFSLIKTRILSKGCCVVRNLLFPQVILFVVMAFAAGSLEWLTGKRWRIASCQGERGPPRAPTWCQWACAYPLGTVGQNLVLNVCVVPDTLLLPSTHPQEWQCVHCRMHTRAFTAAFLTGVQTTRHWLQWVSGALKSPPSGYRTSNGKSGL